MAQPKPLQLVAEVAWVFLKLGLTSFGGPVAHLGYFHVELIERRRWLSEEEFADVVALCQFLPGPASSQVVFAIGQKRAGLGGALAASLAFMLPSVLLMIAFGYGVSAFSDWRAAGWLRGLKLAAVAVVAQAVWTMGRKLCPDLPRILLGLGAAALVTVFPSALVQVGAIAFGGVAGWLLYRGKIDGRKSTAMESKGLTRRHATAAATLVCFAGMLVLVPLLAKSSGDRWLRVFDGFYRAGALVFGGGHVVLPLLQAEVVPPGWIANETFLAGYGVAQAMPGPLFTFAGFLGTVIFSGPRAWLGGLWCLLAIFLPAWLLVGGALPFWHLLRDRSWSQAALREANAVVVGILLAALWHPVWSESVHSIRDMVVVIAAWALLQFWRFPSWAVVLFCAVAGQWLI